MADSLYLPDLGDGRYQNPVLLCDYSDPDVIRVGDTYYLTASSFNYVPGLPILTSRDLVNWELVNYALPAIPEKRYAAPCHAQGVWAPAIRYHDGWFCIYYGMPDEGLFVVRARDPLGAWEAPVCVLEGKGLIDPCPFWDDDGTAWLVHGYAKSRIGFKSVLGLLPLTPDGLRAAGDDHIVYDGQATQPTIEGPKVYKRDGWYYVFAPSGGVATGWQTVLRARDIHGPWEEKVVLHQGSGQVNGPHQGGWVDTPEGQNWFLHFQSRGLYGRVVHLQPMFWDADGWPRMGREDPTPPAPTAFDSGEDAAKAALTAHASGCGIPVDVWEKPHGSECAPLSLQASDDFTGDALNLAWQWMGNPQASFYQLTKQGLRLNACALPGGGDTLWQCPQVLSQKIACLSFTAIVPVDASALRPGEQAGLTLIGGQYAYLALRREADGVLLTYAESHDEDGRKVEQSLCSQPVSERGFLRLTLKNTGYAAAEGTFSFSEDGESWQTFGQSFSPSRHTWVGARVGLFCMPLLGQAGGGHATFGAFQVKPL